MLQLAICGRELKGAFLNVYLLEDDPDSGLDREILRSQDRDSSIRLKWRSVMIQLDNRREAVPRWNEAALFPFLRRQIGPIHLVEEAEAGELPYGGEEGARPLPA